MFGGKKLHYSLTILLIAVFFLLPLLSGCSISPLSFQDQNGTSAPASENALAPGADMPAAEALSADGEEDGDEEEGTETQQGGGNGTVVLTEAEQAVQDILDSALELAESAQELWAGGEGDKALENLDNAYLLITKVTPECGPRFTQQKDDLRFMISKRVMEIYASRLTKVNGTHKEIPLVMNEHVEREIQSFQGQEREFFLESYQRSGLYRDEMAKAFKEAGLPEEITWLPLIESGFKAKALSRSRALGLWQFIPSTGYKFGLKRNDWIDERLHPEKATKAAIAYLKELHQIFGDWATALAAYNCGEGNVFRAIRDQKINYLDNFWDLYARLPRETARYYPRFLAVLTIIKEPEKYGFTLEPPLSPTSSDTVAIEKQVHLSKVAEAVGSDQETLTRMNPELRREATPPTSYRLNVPAGKGETLLASIDGIPKYTPPKVAFVYHRVRRGETLSLIALRYRTSITRIIETNNLRSGRYLRIGQRLKIPMRGTAS